MLHRQRELQIRNILPGIVILHIYYITNCKQKKQTKTIINIQLEDNRVYLIVTSRKLCNYESQYTNFGLWSPEIIPQGMCPNLSYFQK